MTQMMKFVFSLQLSWEGNLIQLSYKVEPVWLNDIFKPNEWLQESKEFLTW